MSFWIQTGNPRIIQSPTVPADASLSELLQAVFPMETEDAILVWNNVHVPLSYKYDISVLIEDLIDLTSFVLLGTSGSKRISFGSDTFRATWLLKLSNGSLHVQADWASVVGGTESLLKKNNILDLPSENFLGEWKSLFSRVLDSLSRAGFSPDFSKQTQELQRIEKNIKRLGRLYEAADEAS